MSLREMKLVDMDARQLFAACRLAHERHPNAMPGTDYVPPFRTPDCCAVTNSELQRLKPLYMELLNQSGIKDEMYDIVENLQPHGSAAMLYVLEFLGLVEQTRSDAGGLAGPVNREGFPLSDLVTQIAGDKRLINWCRTILAEAGAHSECVLTSAIQLLTTAAHLKSVSGGGRGQSRRGDRALRREVLRLEEDASDEQKNAALNALFDDLGQVLSKPTLHAGGVVNSFQLLSKAATQVGTRAAKSSTFARRPAIKFWRAALRRVRAQIGEEHFTIYSEWLMPTPEAMADHVSLSRTERQRDVGFEMICDNPQCNEEGTRQCAGCKATRYCSKECQKAHWKAGHKRQCVQDSDTGEASAAVVNEQVRCEMESLRIRARLSTVEALERRCEEMSLDFILTGDPQKDWGVQFAHPFMQLSWGMIMERAKDETLPKAEREEQLRVMLGYLVEQSNTLETGLSDDLIYEQLVDLYGPFPRST